MWSLFYERMVLVWTCRSRGTLADLRKGACADPVVRCMLGRSEAT